MSGRLAVRKIHSDPVITVHWFSGTHTAHVVLKGKEVSVYSFPAGGDWTNPNPPELKDFNEWLKGAKADIIEACVKGWY